MAEHLVKRIPKITHNADPLDWETIEGGWVLTYKLPYHYYILDTNSGVQYVRETYDALIDYLVGSGYKAKYNFASYTLSNRQNVANITVNCEAAAILVKLRINEELLRTIQYVLDEEYTLPSYTFPTSENVQVENETDWLIDKSKKIATFSSNKNNKVLFKSGEKYQWFIKKVVVFPGGVFNNQSLRNIVKDGYKYGFGFYPLSSKQLPEVENAFSTMDYRYEEGPTYYLKELPDPIKLRLACKLPTEIYEYILEE